MSGLRRLRRDEPPATGRPSRSDAFDQVDGRFPVKMNSMDGKVLLAEPAEQARFLAATDEAVVATSC